MDSPHLNRPKDVYLCDQRLVQDMQYPLLPTEVSRQDLAEAYTDEHGVQLSPDGKRLLRAPRWSLSHYTVPSSVTTICDEAFCTCTSLTAVTPPEGIESIGNSAFNGCTSLTAINLPERLESIGDLAFNGCSSLTAINLPEGLMSIRDSAFHECSSLSPDTRSELERRFGEGVL